MKLELRPHQAADLERLRENVRAGIRRQILVAPTGYGKTVVAGALIESAIEKGKYCHFWAHRQELISQPAALLTAMGIEHGIIRGSDKRRRPWAPVHIASVPTLAKRALDRDPDLIIIDECHRSQAASYRDLLARWPRAIVIGLTATPQRTDGRGLKDLFQTLVVGPSTADLTEQSFLVPARTFAPSRPDLTEVQTTAGDYDKQQLEKAIDKPTLVGNIVSHYLSHASGRSAIAFGVSIKHSLHLVEQFRSAGINSEHIDGSTPDGERSAILARLHSGETQVVCNVGVYVEGIDCPPASCCILARPTKSLTLYLQAVGRVLRPHPGKEDAIILDHAGCALDHGLYDEPREWTLDGRTKRKRGEDIAPEPLVKVCPVCAAAYHQRVSVCVCGYEFFLASRVVAEEPGDLVEIPTKRNYTIRKISEDPAVAALQHEAEIKNYKPGWVWNQRHLLLDARADFRKAFGCDPSQEFDVKKLRRLIAVMRRVEVA